MTNREISETIEVTAEGIGGIETTKVTLERGVNLLEGRNATNRTSFLQALMAVLGSSDVSLKGDRDEGHIELQVGGQTYTRRLRRDGGSITFDGEPYLSDTTEADLFAFLLESNESRQAITNNGDLHDVITRPIDTAEIDRQIRELQSELRDIDDRIESLETEREKLPTLEQRRERIEMELSETREELEEARTNLEAADSDVEDRKEKKGTFEETLDDLNAARNELEHVQYRLETEREALASGREERESAVEKLESLPETPIQQLTDVENEIERLRRQKRTFNTRVSKLHRIVQFNEEMLEGDGDLDGLFDEDESAVTDDLLQESGTTCWTCGSTVEATEIESMLERLRELSQSQRRERNRLEDQLDELTEKRDTLKSAREKQETLSGRIDSLESDIERREATIEELEQEKTEIQNRIETLEAEAQRLEGVSESRVLDLQRNVSETEVTIQQLEDERDEILDQIDQLEANGDRVDELERQRDQIRDQLDELRTRIDRLEDEAVDAFNEHMATLVGLLEYENLSRIWIERRSQETGGDRRDRDSSFELHVVRTTEDGTAYEDTVDHLSESERELVGLVFALAGYVVHEVYEVVPFMLLDSLEAIDSERIALLVDYLSEYSPTIVAALLPEDAQALDESYLRIEEI